MLRIMVWSVIGIGFLIGVNPVLADQFEQLDGPTLVKTLRGADATSRASLTISDIGAMPALLRDTRSALVLARTDRGNPVRMLIIPELRKPADGKGDPIPVVVLERLDSFDASEPSVRLASRKDVVIFDGFQVDLDTGQIVPEGQGGDVVFRINGEAGPRLETLGSSKLYTLAKAPGLDNTKPPQPTPGKTVLPSDFAGRYRLFANGQWSGTLDLKVEGRGVVTGQFRSDLHGTTYAVSGQVATDVAHKILFAIKYPRARQEFEGYLWAEGKGAIAGVASIAERPIGFFAIREGGKIGPEGIEFVATKPQDPKAAQNVVEVLGERVNFNGKPSTLEEVQTLLKLQVESNPAPWVLIQAASDQKYGDILKVAEAVQASGVSIIRFGTIPPRN